MDQVNAVAAVKPEVSYRRSESVGKLVKALLEVQRVAGGVSKDSNAEVEGRGYRYPTLAAVLDTVKPLLTENNILVLQPTRVEGSAVTVTTLLMVDDEFIESSLTLTAAAGTPQSVGSAITYARRYGMLSLLCLAAEDDDGLAAGAAPKPAATPAAPTKPAAPRKAADPKPTPTPTKDVAKEPVASSADGKPADVQPADVKPADAAVVAEQGAASADSPAPTAVVPAASGTGVAEAPVLPGAPEGLTDTEVRTITRLKSAVDDGTCSIERARASLSIGGPAHGQLGEQALQYAKVLILKEPSVAAVDVGF